MRFADRRDAGRRLAEALDHLRREDPIVVGLPRGGVVVAAEVARHLEAPLDVIVVRKLGVPGQPELAMGAIGEGGVRVLDPIADRFDASRVAEVEAREREELARRASVFRETAPRLDVEGRTVVVVDDGVATGATARAACRVAKAAGARRLVVGVPVAPHGWEASFGDTADEYVAVTAPRSMWAIGRFYDDFTQTTDAEVVSLLEAAR